MNELRRKTSEKCRQTDNVENDRSGCQQQPRSMYSQQSSSLSSVFFTPINLRKEKRWRRAERRMKGGGWTVKKVIRFDVVSSWQPSIYRPDRVSHCITNNVATSRRWNPDTIMLPCYLCHLHLHLHPYNHHYPCFYLFHFYLPLSLTLTSMNDIDAVNSE